MPTLGTGKVLCATALLFAGLFGTTLVNLPKVNPEIRGVEVYGKFCPSGFVPFYELVKPLGDLISTGEGDYNAVNRGRAGDTPSGISSITGKDFSDMTVREVMDLQDWKVYAVGRYQFIPVTLRLAVAFSSVDFDDKFTNKNQDILFAALLEYKRPAVAAYIRGDHDYQGWALNDLAKEWASIEYRNGRGFYDHIGGNRAKITREAAMQVIEQLREEYNK